MLRFPDHVGAGMDGLRNALERLEAPDCPNCHVAMRWFRSELVRDAREPFIAHLFLCPNCKRAQQTDTTFTPLRVPPDKLAAPRFSVVR
ncbi:glutaredoxin [Bradyrhizobium sp. USDA 372]